MIEVEDLVVLVFYFSNGFVGMFNMGYYLKWGYSMLVVIWGSKGWVRFDFVGGLLMIWVLIYVDVFRGVQFYNYVIKLDIYYLMIEEVINVI